MDGGIPIFWINRMDNPMKPSRMFANIGLALVCFDLLLIIIAPSAMPPVLTTVGLFCVIISLILLAIDK